MRVVTLTKPGGLDRLAVNERELPAPGPGDLLVRVHASSLNFHDYAVVSGMIPVDDARVPMSDGSGIVEAVGEGVTLFQPGDHVMGTFFPNWIDGEPALEKLLAVPGDRTEGFAAEYVAMPQTAFTRAPKGYSHTQAATLPCAALTAWRALMVEARIKSGDIVLTQGTGGVSIFALQMAKAAGCTVIATSSSDEKLARLKELGADEVINYREIPDWGRKAKALTGGRGVDEVVEIGGPGTLGQSIHAARVGGHISLIGVLTGVSGEVPTAALFSANIRLDGITVGSRAQQLDMVAGLEATGIHPVIDSSFPLEGIADAFRHQESQRHFGKICLAY